MTGSASRDRSSRTDTDRPPYKRPESVLVLIHTLQGEVLMLRRRHPPWFWQSVTGSLEPGESPYHAAQRELFEETGLRGAGRLIDCRHSETFPIIHPWRARYAPDVHFNREHWFRLELPGRRTVRLNPGEHRAAQWLPAGRAARLASSWTNRAAILGLVLCSRRFMGVSPAQGCERGSS